MIKYYYLIILILAVIFFLISYRDVKTLVSIIIIMIIGYLLYIYFEKITNNYTSIIKKNNKELNDAIDNKKELISDNYMINKFPKKIKFLIKDEKLKDIIFNIKFIKVFDNAKYLDIINHMDKFMKIYIYILANRYDPQKYFTSLIDIRQSILEMLYSCFIIVPKDVKYIYGINTHDELYKNINLFASHSSIMINTIKKYSYLEKKIFYLEDTKTVAYNLKNNYNLP